MAWNGFLAADNILGRPVCELQYLPGRSVRIEKAALVAQVVYIPPLAAFCTWPPDVGNLLSVSRQCKRALLTSKTGSPLTNLRSFRLTWPRDPPHGGGCKDRRRDVFSCCPLKGSGFNDFFSLRSTDAVEGASIGSRRELLHLKQGWSENEIRRYCP